MVNFQIEDSALWADIRSILKSSSKTVRFEYRAMLHTEVSDLVITKLISIDIVRDYVNNIGDSIIINFIMPLGDYKSKLYPYRDNLELSLKRIELEEVGTIQKKNTDAIVERFKAVFIQKSNPNISTTEADMIDAESLNKMDIIEVKLQLLDRSLEPLRIKTVSNVYRQVTAKKLIHSVLAGESLQVTVDGKPAIDGIDLVEPNNQEVKQHVILPQGIHITALPTYLQEKMGGVYSAGIGTYLQTYNKKKLWFVYPLFNTKRFDENVDKAIIYSVPKEKLMFSDRTYRKDANILHILATSNKMYKDTAETDYMNFGSGFRIADARSYMKKPVKLSEDGPEGSRVHLNHEVVIADRKDGLNYAPVIGENITSNPFREYSKVLARYVARLDLEWENSDFSLLYPGMPCKYVFLQKEKIIELKGIIVFVHGLISLQGTKGTEATYRSTCSLTILLDSLKFLSEEKTYTRKENF